MSSTASLFSQDQLEALRTKGILAISICGQIFDVTSSSNFYGPGQGYEHFTFKDGTRAFVTGNFDVEGVIPDIDDFDAEKCRGVQNWLDFYIKKYKHLGYLIGYYYNDAGQPTEALKKFQNCVRLVLSICE